MRRTGARGPDHVLLPGPFLRPLPRLADTWVPDFAAFWTLLCQRGAG